MMLRFAEARAKASGSLYSWQIARKDAKAKASKKSKTSKKGENVELTPSLIEKAVDEIMARFAKGEVSAEEVREVLKRAA